MYCLPPQRMNKRTANDEQQTYTEIFSSSCIVFELTFIWYVYGTMEEKIFRNHQEKMNDNILINIGNLMNEKVFITR